MTHPGKLNELSATEDLARELLANLGWTFLPRVALASERGRAGSLSEVAAAVGESNRIHGERALKAGARRGCQ